MLKDRREGVTYLYWCALTAAAVATYFAWFAIVEALPSTLPLEWNRVMLYLLGVLIASFSVHAGKDDYSPRLGRMGLIESVPYTLRQLSRYAAVLLALAFILRDNEVSRRFLMGYLVNMAVVLTVANMYFPPIIARLVFRGSYLPTVLVAAPKEIPKLQAMLAQREHLGIRIVGWVGDGDEEASNGGIDLPRLGSLASLRDVLREHSIAQLVISQLSCPPEQARAIARCGEEAGCRVRVFLHVQPYFPEQPISIEQEGAFTLMSAAREPLENPINRLLKRGLDIAVALPAIAIGLAPLCLVTWLMQRRQSPGPLFYLQERSGLDRLRFRMYKLRTMHAGGAEPAGARQATRTDSRVYPFGRFLRRTSLDEFPQFLNVLFGAMSVSGPRPHLIEHDEQFARVVNTYYTRHFVKPGITGLAQCRGYRGEIVEQGLLEKRIGYDMIYIRRWTFSLDLQILFRTAWQVMFPPRTAY